MRVSEFKRYSNIVAWKREIESKLQLTHSLNRSNTIPPNVTSLWLCGARLSFANKIAKLLHLEKDNGTVLQIMV